MTTKTRTLKSNTVPMKFDAYIVVFNNITLGFDLSMSGAEKMARHWNKSAKLGIKSHNITARKIDVLVSCEGSKSTAEAVDGDDVVGCPSWSAKEIGNALLARKMMDVARPVPFAGGWVVEARFAGNKSPDVLFHLETTGLKFYPATDAARMEAANPTLSFGMAGKGRSGALRSCLRQAREAWLSNPSYF